MSDMESYFNLREENDSLRSRVAELENSMPGSFRLIDNNFAMIDDTLFERNFNYQQAKVIQSTIGLNNNYITINRGTKQDVVENMVVRSNDGLVGIVDRVTENYALILPIIHPKFSAGVSIPRTGHFGSLTWNTEDHRSAQIGVIPTEAEIEVGDLVQTRGGKESKYPSGIIVGRVKSKTAEEGDSFFEIDVELAVDFSMLNSVYVIENTFSAELDSLNNFMLQDE